MGYLCAIFLTILAGQVIVHGLLTGVAGMTVPVEKMWLVFTPVKTIITVMIVIAVLRGILHYVEQYCNHFIAFKLLAITRQQGVFALVAYLVVGVVIPLWNGRRGGGSGMKFRTNLAN